MSGRDGESDFPRLHAGNDIFPACRSAAMRVYTRAMDTLCYCAAVRAAARKTTALYDAALAPAGVTLAQYSLMRRIERAGTVSLTQLGRLAEFDRSTVGRNVKALEGLGFVRLGSADDQREAAVVLHARPEPTRCSAPLRFGRSPAAGRDRSGRKRGRAASDASATVFDFFANMRALTHNTGFKHDRVGAGCNDFERLSAATTAGAILSFLPARDAHGGRGCYYGWVVAGATFLVMLATAGAMGAPGVIIRRSNMNSAGARRTFPSRFPCGCAVRPDRAFRRGFHQPLRGATRHRRGGADDRRSDARLARDD